MLVINFDDSDGYRVEKLFPNEYIKIMVNLCSETCQRTFVKILFTSLMRKSGT